MRLLDKKSSNTLSKLTTVTVAAIGLLFLTMQGAFAPEYFSPIYVGVHLSVFVLPLFVIYANNRSDRGLSSFDQVLQGLFHLAWLSLGLMGILTFGNVFILSSIFSLAIVLLGIILTKSILEGKYKAPKVVAETMAKPIRSVVQAATPYIVIDLLMFGIFGYLIYYTLNDKSGWSGLFTVPVFLVVALVLIIDATCLVVLAFKSKGARRKLAFLLWGVFSLLPIIFVITYSVVAYQLTEQADRRARTQIPLSEAQSLVETCQVETLYRDDGGRMQLNAQTPVLFGMDSRPERRSFDVKLYDQLFELARRKDVEDRCGFVPTYDIQRARKPEVRKWITREEAEEIMDKCLWNTDFYEDSRGFDYFKDYPEGPITTGILLKQRLSVWNDDTESVIVLVLVDESTKSALKQKDKACLDRQIEQWKSAR